MIKKILIANRGEIACRIIRTATKMGIKAIAVYSDADKNSLHVRLADDAIYVGPATATQSYLNHKRILDAVKLSGADAVHPGYGFLSENAEFAELLEKNGITFIGPSSDAIRKMGDKIQAKKIAQAAGVNIIPGYIGAIKNEKDALKIASKIGYPIMLKAVAGGGGKGIRVVRSPEEMQQAFNSTKNEAKNNFADGRTFIEKFIENPRHIEIQLIADQHGNYLCFGERECSIQRHHQKVIEEAPSAFIDEKMRKKMYAQSVALAKKVKYFSAGTLEYIVDNDKNFYFLEMNTRLQVEHPVTELVASVDLVELMIKIACGEKLQIKQKDIKLNGWVLECRIYAEDPSGGFLPSTGRINTYKEPTSTAFVRVDSGVYEGGEISMFYDAMISKLCTHAPTRQQAINLMKDALGQYVIRGVSHNISFLQAILATQRFLEADLSTNFIDDEYKDGFAGAILGSEESVVVLCAGVYILMTDAQRANRVNGQLRSAQKKSLGTRWVVRIEDKSYPVTVRPIEDGYKIAFETRRFYITSRWILGSKLFHCVINGANYSVQIEYVKGGLNLTFMGHTVRVSLFTPRAAELNKFMKKKTVNFVQNDLVANISGLVSDVKVKKGDQVVRGQHAVVIEAMKMENILSIPTEGKVVNLHVEKGKTVNSGDLLIEIEPAS
ncbi:acetyl/propionyl/methylcrotonyl-CoA carboxylase subunit alpha [Candidatus Lariskella endosymbiont of Hedychridium roseum]|uniref:acetyl/propionyl/methylcrotonyl-CoA carboxylase subunit alpha n=1 Tax=Candidatus Lariskella endosymbiont of Hedychridium roseum TaxID=3077949 RepID=UPI0030D17512